MQEEDRKPLAYGALSLLATVVIAALQVKYPTWQPALLNFLLWGGLAGIAACAVWLVYEHLSDQNKEKWKRKRFSSLIGMIFCSIGLLGFAAAYFWPKSVGGEARQESEAKTSNDMDYSVAVKCSFAQLPTTARPDKPLQYLQVIGPPENSNSDLRMYITNTFQTPGSYQTTWPEGMSPLNLRCVVSNYGTRAIASIILGFKIQWLQTIRDGNNTRSAGTIAEIRYDIGSLDLSPPPGQTDYFYIFSLARSYVLVTLPEEAAVTFVGSDETHTIKLVKRNSPALEQYALPPFVPPKDRLNGPLPGPAPQSPPAGK